MVAKTFQGENYELRGEPFSEGKKSYIIVYNKKTKKERKVRWYSEVEYAVLYPNEAKLVVTQKPRWEVLGFGSKDGSVTVFRAKKISGDSQKWFEESCARRNKFWDWHLPNGVSVEGIPEDVKPVELKWLEVCDESGDNLMSESELDKVIMKKIGRRPSKSLL